MKKTPIQNFFKNSKSLKWFLDNYGEIEGGEDFIESYNQDSHVIPTCEMIGFDPTCLDYYIEDKNFDPERIDFTYETGYYFNMDYGEIKEVRNSFCNQIIEKEKCKFLTTYPLSEEIEFQADDGEFECLYIGPNFLCVWEKEVDKNE